MYLNKVFSAPIRVPTDPINMLRKQYNDRYRSLITAYPHIPEYYSYGWYDPIKNGKSGEIGIDFDYGEYRENALTITLRGTYSTGRNRILKAMYLIDNNIHTLHEDINYPYFFTVSPLFKTIFVGMFEGYQSPWNKIDRYDIRDISIDKMMSLISEIYEDPRWQTYNFIFDGSKFQPYLNKMRDHALLHGRRRYFDLYILDHKTYDYLNTPIESCYYDVYGWNKYPKLSKDMCVIESNLYESYELDPKIPTFALVNKDPLRMLIDLMYFNLDDIQHYRHRPLIQTQ